MRLFVALDVPDTVRQALSDLVARCKRLCSGARWVNLTSVHVTLKFIGEVAPEKGERIRAALSQVRGVAPFELRFTGLGFFPNTRRPRVFWAGIEPAIRDDESLPRLAAAIDAQLEPLGIPREKRDFKPHLTLARFNPLKAPVKGIGDLQAAAAKFGSAESGSGEFGRIRVEQFHLYRSVLKPTGAEYTRLAAYPIGVETS